MVSAILGVDAANSELAAVVHDRSDGVPLHVEEILAALRARPTPVDARELPVPDTVAEAILERAARLSPNALDVARRATVVGRAFPLDLLEAVTDAPSGDVAAAIAELYEKQFVVSGREGTSMRFRHALICDVLYERIPSAERREVHRRVAGAAAARTDLADPPYVATQYERAGDRIEAFRWALLAARSAAARSAHRAAAAGYRLALKNARDDLSGVERAGLLIEHASEAAAIDDNETAATAYSEARRLLSDAGETVRAAELAVPLAAVRHLLGAALEERRSLLVGALADLGGVHLGKDSGDVARAVRSRIQAGLAAAYMLDRRLDEAALAGENALRDARDAATEMNALITVGAVKVFAGDMTAGWSMLEEGTAGAKDRGLEAEAARGYRMIGSCASVLVEYGRAERWLREGIAYAERVELWNHRHYMAAHLAHVLWATGRWPEASKLAEDALADGRGGITTRITALHVMGYLALGRGDRSAADDALEEARELGQAMAELQRLSPALWGLAENALLNGDAAGAVALADDGRVVSERYQDAAYLFPFVLTGLRAHLALGEPGAAEEWLRSTDPLIRRRSIPGTLTVIDHASGLLLVAKGTTARGRELLESARAAWLGRRRMWEGTWALVDLARCDLRAGKVDEGLRLAAEARDVALSFGATALAGVAASIADLAIRRGALEEEWAPLTAREFDVARSISAGLTNAQIAAELRISPRTVATHVEHILAKLGASRRAEIAAWASARMRQ